MWSRLPDIPKPRLLKTHLRPGYFRRQLGEGHLKVVFVLRNPRDTLVSYYHFYQQMPDLGKFTGSWDDFYSMIRADDLVYGDWLRFTEDWWQKRHLENVHVIKYEDMKADPRGHVIRLAQFCERDLTETQIDTIVEATSFATMKKQAHNNFKLRKGAIGDWKNYLTSPQLDYFQEIENKLSQEGLNFKIQD